MNSIDRKDLKDIINKLYDINSVISEFDFNIVEDIIDNLTDVKEDEEVKFDNLNESLQQTDNANKMQQASENLQISIDYLEDFDFESFTRNIENLINNLEMVNKYN